MSLINQIVGGLSGLDGMPSNGFFGGGRSRGMFGGGMLGGGGLGSSIGGALGMGNMVSSGVKGLLLGGLLSMIMNRSFGGGNGLSGLLDKFRGSGMTPHADSWVSTDKNQQLSPSQVEQALGPQIQQLAQKAGIPQEQAAQYLSELIPQVVDRLTPSGQVPDQGTISSALGRLFGH